MWLRAFGKKSYYMTRHIIPYLVYSLLALENVVNLLHGIFSRHVPSEPQPANLLNRFENNYMSSIFHFLISVWGTPNNNTLTVYTQVRSGCYYFSWLSPVPSTSP